MGLFQFNHFANVVEHRNMFWHLENGTQITASILIIHQFMLMLQRLYISKVYKLTSALILEPCLDIFFKLLS